MKHTIRVGTLNGWPVYKDSHGDLCIESNGFQNLRYLTDEEERQVSKQLKNLITTDEHSEALQAQEK